MAMITEVVVRIVGVHLEEPSPSLSDHRWSSHVGGAVKAKWTDEDLDAFVLQLSNPQHHVTKLGPIKAAAGGGGGTGRHSAHVPSLDSPRKDSFELCHELQGVDRVRAPLARSETDTSVALSCERHKDMTYNLSRSGEDVSRSLGGEGGGSKSATTTGNSGGSGGLISGLSGLRLIKNKKLARSSHANAKRSAAAAAALHKSKDDVTGSQSSSGETGSGHVVTFSCNGSSPESSDVEASTSATAPIAPDQSTSGASGKEVGAAVTSKKRRFRKMLSRPLHRSQSAGCSKDVAAHALFLEKQQKKSKDDSMTARKARASEGDIRHTRLDSDEIEDDDDTTTSVASSNTNGNGGKKLLGRIHKTKSADAAMLTPEEEGSVVAPPSKHKSRNIAKKISKKMQFLRRRHTDSTLGVVERDEGARRLTTIDPEEAQEWSKSFNTLLFDKKGSCGGDDDDDDDDDDTDTKWWAIMVVAKHVPCTSGLELFRGFLLSEHSDENIEFWIACENYKNSKSSKQLPSLAQKIFNDYVAVQARREVNLDSKTRNMTYESVTSNPNRQTFDEAQRRVQALMEKDSYRRFLESEIYVDLASGNLHHKS
ncbi:regulator of G-protein signaling [Elysia marginata]|uniref:Regulator of G-protein signaling n=1 Tax=Elysia marginata TaxID=1093978 RepID=A0AAV4IXV1_9GAST|nr:regulator of G-protein signaling [Elysia marginata]